MPVPAAPSFEPAPAPGYGPAVAPPGYGGAPAIGAAPPPAGPHVALILRAHSPSFAQPAEAVRAGFFEAWQRQAEALPAHLYAVGDDSRALPGVYRNAVASGARVVVGPLTRDGVNALASDPASITVPTLVLNVPDSGGTRPRQLYTLSLTIEAEARQIARLALAEGRRKAFTVSEPTPLARRMREAFVEAFERDGGSHIADYAYTTDTASLERMRQAASLGVADMVFFAIGAQRVGTVRTYMTPIAAYGTSQLNPGNAASANPVDLANVRFVDMPWMVQPDHPAVMVFARQGPRLPDDLERLYALGIDAARIAIELLAGRNNVELDGVTGHLRSGPDGQIRRGLLVTLIDGGQLTVLGESGP